MKLTHRQPGGGSPILSQWGMDSEYGVLRDVLLGPMDHYSWQSGNAMSRRSQRLGRRFDRETARAQYGEMLDAYRQAGVNTHILEPDPVLPYQLYARDSSVMTPWGPIVTQMYSPWRRGEWKPVLEFYRDREIPVYDVVTAGAFEGGDFMVLEPGLVVCGSSGERTSPEGLAQVQDWIEAEGWEFVSYRFDPYFLHLDVKLAMLDHKLAAACIQALEQDFVDWLRGRGIELIDISYRAMLELGCNVVALGNGRVLLPKDNTELAQKCRAHGLTVIDPDVSMFTAGGGGVHCMCQPLRREKAPG
ncbi:dimethylarginine dimethylaminohydrolase family protein [Parahaliea mediterranea]|uniref:arginine deiminase n=1 Tax=Parahaliea mediterranea TaxID=651086 RepID=A0A939DER4_9GAMM|nr:arginine deiminase family protein [Parahaliea mediterranea]MBN7796883.1 amidinotransferase [Parahaliea mediterranea]